MIWQILTLVFAAGIVGGLVNSLMAGEFQLPRRDRQANVYKPGWMGSCLIGGLAAVAFWGLYGPLTGYLLIGTSDAAVAPPTLNVGELFGSLVTGIGGGKLLLGQVDRRVLKSERDALIATKSTLADVVKNLTAPRQRSKELGK
jgi:hypothetical protein